MVNLLKDLFIKEILIALNYLCFKYWLNCRRLFISLVFFSTSTLPDRFKHNLDVA